MLWMCIPISTSIAISWTYLHEHKLPSLKALGHSHPTPEVQKTYKQVQTRIVQRNTAFRTSYIWASIAMLGGTLLLAIFGGMLFIRFVSIRIAQLRHQLHLSAPQAFSQSKPLPSSAPFQALSDDLKELLIQFREQQHNEVFKEQVARWQDVARRMAHEIRNPLTPILLSVQELNKRYSGSNEAYKKQLQMSVEIVKDEVETLRRLVEEFSSFAKLPQVRMQTEEVTQVVRDFLEAYNWFREHVKIQFEPESSACWAGLDRILFRQVLVNLIQNAIEAGSPEIVIRVGQLSDRQIVCQIEDHGPGIPSHLQSKIFTPYFTTKKFGTGLGLSITKKIIIDHGGTIHVSPHSSGGSVFTIRLRSVAQPFEKKVSE